ncbi:MAG: Holliday junction branch migration protein RuvA [Eubacteriales bacterium]|nr:Holliday junction branch migration protein RuvA [Eubacteriales bacterium]
MFAYIKGVIEAKEADHIVLAVGPLGYMINCDLGMMGRFPQVGDECKVYTYQHVREDAIMLYGFPTQVEKSLFEQLITVSGIGPKLAATIVAGLEPTQLIMAIIQNDLKTLRSIKGIGKKTAERLVLELKDKLKNFTESSADDFITLESPATQDGLLFEAISALQILGYKESEAEPTVQAVFKENPELGLEDLIRLSLKGLAKV